MSSNRPRTTTCPTRISRAMRRREPDARRTVRVDARWRRASVGFQGREDIASSSARERRLLPDAPPCSRRSAGCSTRDDDHAGSRSPCSATATGSAALAAARSCRRQHLSESSALHDCRRRAQGVRRPEVGTSSDVIIPLRAGERFGGSSAIWNDAFATWIKIMGRRARGRRRSSGGRRSEADFRAGQRVGRAGQPRATRLPPASRAKHA